MLGSEFVEQFAGKGPAAWEAAALQLARADALVPWPWVELPLEDAERQNRVVLRVQSDVLAVGTLEDHVRLPMTPGGGQSVLNLFGWVYPTPWVVYQMWRAAPLRLPPTPLPNRGADLRQYLEHSRIIDGQVGAVGEGAPGQLRAGMKKHVVVSNIAKPGKVLIFGWYRPPPAPDVFDDGRPMVAPGRQPIQPRSNVHGADYCDYSHGIHAVAPTALVNGTEMATADLYQHPTLSRLVSNEGPVRVPRYPAVVPPANARAVQPNLPMRAAIDVVPSVPAGFDPALFTLLRARGFRS